MAYKQGEIIKVALDPIKGHEQAGYRPVIVLQNTMVSELFESVTIVAPITTSSTRYPFEVDLDDRCKTKGHILCRHIRALDLNNRYVLPVEKAPSDIMSKCIECISALLEQDKAL